MTSEQVYTVQLGDTLTAIALATESVASAWPDLHYRNRDVIGSDPHTILPGMKIKVSGEPRIPMETARSMARRGVSKLPRA